MAVRRNAPMTHPPCQIEFLLGEYIDSDSDDEEMFVTKRPTNVNSSSSRIDTQRNAQRLQEKNKKTAIAIREKLRNGNGFPMLTPAFPRQNRNSSETHRGSSEDDSSDEERYQKQVKLRKEVVEYLKSQTYPVLVPYRDQNLPEEDSDIEYDVPKQIPKLKPKKPLTTDVGYYFTEDYLSKLRVDIQAQTERVMEEVRKNPRKMQRYKDRVEAEKKRKALNKARLADFDIEIID